MCCCHVEDMFNYFLLLLFGGCVCLVDKVGTVRIRELRVPAVARHGAAVVLDCDYILDGPEDHEGLVVKWYLNDQFRPVYQWIPGRTAGPRELGVMRGRLNLEYRASQDERTQYRALHISAPGPDLAGEYTCVVSTFKGEDRQTKNMLVFVPEKNLRLQRRRTSDGSSNAVCSAEGVFPEPEMIIRITYENVSRELDGGAVLHRQPDGLYDVSLEASLPAPPKDVQELTEVSPVAVACQLSIPAVNYTAHKDLLYYPGTPDPVEEELAINSENMTDLNLTEGFVHDLYDP